MSRRLKVALSIVALGQVVGLFLVFLGMVGDFNSSAASQFDEEDSSKNSLKAVPPLADENEPNRVVLMVVDALRSDMLTTRNFPFLLGSLKNNKKTGILHYNVTVGSPTVTLPRIKTLVTGKAPAYLDILKNFQTSDTSYSSNQLHQDNIIQRLILQRPQVKICFFGDETWLRLFPPDGQGSSKFFDKWEGVTSFFVKDFVEVDKNVSRHLETFEDCHFLILHYLGLDHIGHVHGPSERPDLIHNKLLEMDKVVQKMYSKISKTKNVILLTGDHGMANAGGHGGSSFEEVTTSLVAVITGVNHGKNLVPLQPMVYQEDIASTLATLWGIQVPRESQGKVLLDIVEPFYSSQNLVNVFQENCEHLLKLLGESREAATYRLWLTEISKMEKSLSARKYVELASELSAAVHSSVSEKSVFTAKFFWGVVLLLISECVALYIVIRKIASAWTGLTLPLMLSFFSPCFLYFSSSFIEEEHYPRYFFLSCLLMCIYFYETPCDNMSAWKICNVLFYHRILTSFNQTGDKWSSIPDVNDTIVQENLTWISAVIGTFFIWRFLKLTGRSSTLGTSTLVYICIWKIVTSLDKVNLGYFRIEDVLLQQIAYLLITANLAWNALQISINTSIFTTVLLLVLNLQRLQNIIVVGLLLTELYEIISLFHRQHLLKAESVPYSSVRTQLITQLVFIWLAHASFFYQGNSNGYATVDVSAGYIGFGSFASSALIGILIFLNTYGNPILIHLHFLMIKTHYTTDNSSKQHCNGISSSFDDDNAKLSNPLPALSLFSNGAEGIIYSIVLIVFRNHLFIWSVFVPKLLYLLSQSVMFLMLSIIYFSI